MCRWIKAECADPVVGPQLGLKVPRGHVVCAHPGGVVSEGFVWSCTGDCQESEQQAEPEVEAPADLEIEPGREHKPKPKRKGKRKPSDTKPSKPSDEAEEDG